MESCSDSDSNDDGLEIGRHGHGDEDIVINTEHASKEVDAEGDGEAEAVAGVDEGMNSCLGRILPRREGDESGDEEESNNNELTMTRDHKGIKFSPSTRSETRRGGIKFSPSSRSETRSETRRGGS